MNFKETIQKCILQVREECVFFGALMLFAEVKGLQIKFQLQQLMVLFCISMKIFYSPCLQVSKMH